MASHASPSPAAEEPAESTGTKDAPRRKKLRRAVYVSEADRRLLELGLPPSWEQKISDADLSVDQDAAARQVAADTASNDRRLMENVPPHAHARM